MSPMSSVDHKWLEDFIALARVRSTQRGGDWVALEQGHADFMLSYSHPRLQLSLDSNAFDSVTVAQEELVAVSAPSALGVAMHQLPGSAQSPAPVTQRFGAGGVEGFCRVALILQVVSLCLHECGDRMFRCSSTRAALAQCLCRALSGGLRFDATLVTMYLGAVPSIIFWAAALKRLNKH
jgi:hypothetical protein